MLNLSHIFDYHCGCTPTVPRCSGLILDSSVSCCFCSRWVHLRFQFALSTWFICTAVLHGALLRSWMLNSVASHRVTQPCDLQTFNNQLRKPWPVLTRYIGNAWQKKTTAKSSGWSVVSYGSGWSVVSYGFDNDLLAYAITFFIPSCSCDSFSPMPKSLASVSRVNLPWSRGYDQRGQYLVPRTPLRFPRVSAAQYQQTNGWTSCSMKQSEEASNRPAESVFLPCDLIHLSG